MRALAVLPLLLAGCGVPWDGGTTAPVEPVIVADAQLVPAVPEGSVSLVPEAAQPGSGARVAPDGATGVQLSGTGSALRETTVAEAHLEPSVANGSTSLVPVVPEATVALATGSEPARPAPRTGITAPAAFALATSHGVGQPRYQRSGATRGDCGAYVSAHAAQDAFLAAGGPEADPLGLDRDGDGFACRFDPEPYRRAARG